MKKIIAILTFLLSWSLISRADSPLTSTDFAMAYSSSPMVQMAKGIQGDEIPMKLISFLADSKAPVDERLAVVNQIGWNFDGMTTGTRLFDYLAAKYAADEISDLAEKLDAGTLAVFAYATAMSDYFDVSGALFLAHKAVEKNTGKSFSVAMAAALIEAQKNMDDDWTQVYKVVADVVGDKTLRRDMKQEAIDIIMEYINLYKD